MVIRDWTDKELKSSLHKIYAMKLTQRTCTSCAFSSNLVSRVSFPDQKTGRRETLGTRLLLQGESYKNFQNK